ncbi:MAG: PQQ-dependent sugar dehydrogenase [Nocardioidaceae bacterium]|nr:PQQ-dependent sugar dehydrogenase [Nocardioidaceae bacterium]NUS51912.1 PQQ-dependent sugar dehydrogenase [Nocardioidaceae bacterium]
MDRRTLLRAGLLTPAAATVPLVTAAPAEAAPRVTRTLARGLDTPWNIAFLPSGHALVTERDTGWVTLVRRTGGKHRIRQLAIHHEGESGLLGLALHPSFASNRLVYAYLTSATDNRVVRMRYSGGALSAPEPIVTGIPSNSIHNGGGLAFGRSGRLYISTGDAGVAENAQNRGSLSGKILRVTSAGAPVADNPFGSRVWTFGHRNPEGITFGPGGHLWASEFGQNTFDELNHIVRGRNYGWPRVEGRDGPGGFTDPLTQWHPENCSPSGIAVTRDRAWIGALRGQCLWSVVLTGPNRGRRARFFLRRFGRIRSVAKAPDGSLWIGTSNRDGRGTPAQADDRILRIAL